MLDEVINKSLLNSNSNYALFIKNFTTDEHISINAEVQIPSASIIKLFIMGAAFQGVQENLFTVHDPITIKEEDKMPYSIISLLETNNTYSIQDLITLMIIQSDNTATNLMISLLSMEYINSFIKNYGMKHTVLARKMMDFSAKKSGYENYTTADDISKYLNLLYEGKVVNPFYSQKMLDIMSNQLDGSMMKRELPVEIHIAHKTGDLPYMKHDVGIVYTPKGDYIFSMFTWDAMDDICGKKLIGTVSKSVYDYLSATHVASGILKC
ncbi:serine hydrolase [Clostridium sp. CF012]|uniref:serine hydrolase n=1 Tax=Clostridium sp. CF012 TaxID=2843319 RepID=UPI001C0DBFFA|nr:serine hydrolase [Clostridium sp. CF012]MBU3143627.1 class A beta-lactamase-related serine hydrolase [Clostridium sp. CF012]